MSDRLKFECPYCEIASPAYQWDSATRNEFGENIALIQGSDNELMLFVCPECDEISEMVDGELTIYEIYL
jgi:predicted RNA-binding Zn-ribbon protein involved in translation (DUF1610 family)